jgi:hypothetical protein
MSGARAAVQALTGQAAHWGNEADLLEAIGMPEASLAALDQGLAFYRDARELALASGDPKAPKAPTGSAFIAS